MQNVEMPERRTRGQVFGVPNEAAVLRLLATKANALRRLGGERRMTRRLMSRQSRPAWAA